MTNDIRKCEWITISVPLEMEYYKKLFMIAAKNDTTPQRAAQKIVKKALLDIMIDDQEGTK